MLVSLNVIEDIVKTPKKQGDRPKIIKRGMQSRILLDSTKFTPREVYNEKGKILKDRCLIMDEKGVEFLVKHSYEELCRLKGMIQVKGFRK